MPSACRADHVSVLPAWTSGRSCGGGGRFSLIARGRVDVLLAALS